MFRSTKTIFNARLWLVAIILLGSGFAVSAAATWVDNQNATSVLGQTNFTLGTAAVGPAAMFQPSAVKFDPTSGKLFVADCANNRILRFPNVQAISNGGSAEAAFGQTDLNSATGGFSSSKIRCSGEMAIDSSGHLWVADTDNSRVLRWDNAATASSGPVAAVVLGQPDFTTTIAGTTASKMNLPEGLFLDANGTTLWVADTGNNRVLRFDNAAAKATGASADAVLGQIDFVSSGAAMTQSNLAAPNSVTGNAAGSIWISDSGNSRVLRFDVAASKANGGSADGILGSTSYTALTTVATSRTGMDTPTGVTVDPQNRLYVADGPNNRVLIFDSAPALPDGTGATNVLGQPNYTDPTARLSQSGFDMPYTPTWDNSSQSLWVADLANNRVMRFVPLTTTSGNVGITGRVLNRAGGGVRNARVTFSDPSGTIRAATTNSFGYYTFGNVPSGATIVINVSSRNYTYASRVVQVFNNLTGVDFSPQ